MAFAHLRRRRAPLHGFAAILLSFVAGSAWAQAPATVSPEFKRLLDADAWQLDYQITFKATSSGAGKGLMGPLSYQTALNFAATETLPIESRSQGASLSMQKVMRNAAGPGLQKALMDIVMQGDNIASWMVVDSALAALGDDVTAEKLQAYAVAAGKKSIGTMTVDYTRESRGDKLVNELGDPFKQTIRTTRRGTGGVALSSQQITLEVNGATKRLLVTLPLTLPTVTDATLTEEIVTTTELPPGSKPTEERSTSMRPLGGFPGQLKATEAALAFGDGGAVMIDDPIVLQGGKISGQHTTTATYKENNEPISGTLVVKYTLTPR
jgi:lipoprotein-anchoring transpeptidase ErfK/SrfK